MSTRSSLPHSSIPSRETEFRACAEAQRPLTLAASTLVSLAARLTLRAQIAAASLSLLSASLSLLSAGFSLLSSPPAPAVATVPHRAAAEQPLPCPRPQGLPPQPFCTSSLCVAFVTAAGRSNRARLRSYAKLLEESNAAKHADRRDAQHACMDD
eukprot:5022406-Pleurochrysis_carterae.AAC.1